MTDEEVNGICDVIRQTAYDIHVYLGIGYLERVYENALRHRLEKKGLEVQVQVPMKVCDEDGFCIGEYVADMVVQGIVIELKAVAALTNVHFAQVINYLKTLHLRHGMVINFGSPQFQCKKIVWSF